MAAAVRSFEELREECLQKGELWEDPDFPATQASVFYHQTPPFTFEWKRPNVSVFRTTECVNSLVVRFVKQFLSKFPWPMGHTTAAVQPSKKKMTRGTYTKTFWQTLRPSY